MGQYPRLARKAAPMATANWLGKGQYHSSDLEGERVGLRSGRDDDGDFVCHLDRLPYNVLDIRRGSKAPNEDNLLNWNIRIVAVQDPSASNLP